jgi:hyperosmotically inducible periplasmic protein
MSRFVSWTLVCIVGAGISLSAQTVQRKTTNPDNTKTNERDRAANSPTAGQQKENRSDLDITRDIRRSITKDKALSTYAHNVKVITQNGNVTLKGPVRSEDEKAAVEAKASAVAGATHVKSEIEVAPTTGAATGKASKRP